jgi:hypothetical protein
MDFKSLLSKINELNGTPDEIRGEQADQPANEQMPDTSIQSDQPLVDTDVEECGMPGMSNMPTGMMGAPKQQDNVTMNLSMNGSGAGGIRDLMSILKNIEGGEASDKNMVIGVGEANMDGGFSDATTKPNEKVASISAVTPKGNDIHSKGGEAEKVNGGGNPMQAGVSEGLLAQLANLYQEVKLR